jgi:hypothetical protein
MLLMEYRTASEFSGFLAAWPALLTGPRGDGRPVLVLPPFGASDVYTQPLRYLLRALGYRAEGWELGHNLGRTPAVVEGVPRRLLELHEESGAPVSLVGWSMGGVLARELAREYPDAVRQVIGLAAPFRLRHDDVHLSNASLLYEMVRGLQAEPSASMLLHEHERGPMPVPCTSIYSRSDGVVSWETCVDDPGPRAENIEVVGSHCGLGHNPAAVIAVLDRLAQPEGTWKRFVPPRGAEYLYPDAMSFASA